MTVMIMGEASVARLFVVRPAPTLLYIGALAILLCTAIGPEVNAAQESIHTRLFRDAEAARARAKERNADVYAPKKFTKAMDSYQEANDAFDRRRPLDEIQERIRAAIGYFNAAIEASASAEAVFTSTMNARRDAMSADAIRSSPELWNKGEALFRSAATALEEGSPASARADGAEARTLYRRAELEAIKATLLSAARNLLSRADDMKVQSSAPQTLERARKLANLAEAMIQQNRNDNTEARRLATEASFEAAHAIYLHQTISRLRDQGRGLEDAVLLAEAAMGKIGQALNIRVPFGAGFEPAADLITAAVRTRDSVATVLTDSLKRIRSEADNLRRRLALLERSIGAAPPEADSLRKAEARTTHDQTTARAASLFTTEEGLVQRDGNAVMLRIYGLAFLPGKNTIESQSSALMGKIVRALQMFPHCQVTVEGHTEITGNALANQRASEDRADAVAEYLRRALPASTPILSQGYGGSRPIADTTPREGEGQNRRIDIIVVPEWAILGR